MKELIPQDEYGIFADMEDTARADSLQVARIFEKQHKDVLETIRRITSPNSGLSEDFNQRNFRLVKYTDAKGEKRPAYAMTRDGFTLLAMGFTGKKAMQFKEAYIKRFNEMESFVCKVIAARNDFPMLTEAILVAHDEPKPYHFSNEVDMLNRIITGHSAKEFRQMHGIEKGKSIRPYLTPEQIELVDILQKIDMGLLISTPDYQQRKRYLEWYVAKQRQKLTA